MSASRAVLVAQARFGVGKQRDAGMSSFTARSASRTTWSTLSRSTPGIEATGCACCRRRPRTSARSDRRWSARFPAPAGAPIRPCGCGAGDGEIEARRGGGAGGLGHGRAPRRVIYTVLAVRSREAKAFPIGLDRPLHCEEPHGGDEATSRVQAVTVGSLRRFAPRNDELNQSETALHARRRPTSSIKRKSRRGSVGDLTNRKVHRKSRRVVRRGRRARARRPISATCKVRPQRIAQEPRAQAPTLLHSR